MNIVLNAKAAGSSDAHHFGETYITKLGEAHTKIAEAERNVVVLGIKFGKQPSRPAPRSEQFTTGAKSNSFSPRVRRSRSSCPFASMRVFCSSSSRFIFLFSFFMIEIGAADAASISTAAPLNSGAAKVRVKKTGRAVGPHEGPTQKNNKQKV